MTSGLIDLKSLEDRIAAYFEVDSRIFVTGWVDSSKIGRVWFTTLTSGGPVKEGDRIPAFYATEFRAMEEWWQSFLHYAQSRPPGVVLWRTFPEMIECRLEEEFSHMTLYYVRARLLIVPHGSVVE